METRAYFGEESDQKTQEHRRSNLQTERQLPLGIVILRKAGVRSIANPSSTERSNAQHELLQGRNSTTDAGVADLGLVERNHHSEETDTKNRK